MLIAVDFDGTVVEQEGRAYDDVTTPLVFMPHAEPGLRSLKTAGHQLLLWSGRASRALLIDPMLDPWVRAGVRRVDRDAWERSLPLNHARHAQMIDFVTTRLAGVFDAIDDGAAGKPHADLIIDNIAARLGAGGPGAMGWRQIAALFGAPLYAAAGRPATG